MAEEQTKEREVQPADGARPEAVGEPVGEPAASASEKPVAELPAADEEGSDSIFAEFWLFLKEEKKWWLAPLIVVLMVLSAVIVFAEGSAIAPFIYTIF